MILSKIAFFNGFAMANGFAIASVLLLCLQDGGPELARRHITIGVLFLILAVFSMVLGWLAQSRYYAQMDEEERR